METKNVEQSCLQCEELARLFHRAAKMMARTFHRHSHVSTAQAHVYSILKKNGPMSQAELLQMLDVRSSSLSEVLGKLEQNGLIARTRNENDKRSFVISINEGVTPPFPEHGKSKDKGADAMFACLDDQERSQLGSLLQKVIEAAVEKGGEDVIGDRHDHHSDAAKMIGRHGGKRKHHHKGGRREGDDIETSEAPIPALGQGKIHGKGKRGKK